MRVNPEKVVLEKEVQGLRNVLSVAQVVVSSLDLDEVLQNILCSAMAIMDLPAGSIALYDPETERLRLHVHSGFSDAFVARQSWKVKPGGLTQQILDDGKCFIIEDTVEAQFFNNPLALEEGIRSLVAAPLKIQEKILGILYLDDFVPRRFSEDQLQLLSVLGSFAAMSIDNACLHQRVQRLASTDGLTGLYNHQQFKKMFKDELGRSKRHQKPLALVMLDIDNFKNFNDTFGHPSGDQALALVAEILRQSLRECDMIFRYGGEEFIAVLPETTLDDAIVVAERTRAAVECQSGPRLENICLRGLTVSIGVAGFPADGKTDGALLEVVDRLLYRAKREGKNRVCHQSCAQVS